MSTTWQGPPPPPHEPFGAGDYVRILLRGAAILALLAICFPLLLILRLPERAIWGGSRPVTPWITQTVCVLTCRIMGLRHQQHGQIARGPGAFVANHVSWLDIFTLNACTRLYFVAKAEVAGWAGIGWLARGTGTLFIARDRAQAKSHTDALQARLGAGHKLLFFPEGTSTDGRRVLPFRSTLFQAFYAETLPRDLHIQPVSVIYTAPPGRDPVFYGWWGDMEFGPSLLTVLAAPRQGRVDIAFHPPIRVQDLPDRKALAQAAAAPIQADMAKAMAQEG